MWMVIYEKIVNCAQGSAGNCRDSDAILLCHMGTRDMIFSELNWRTKLVDFFTEQPNQSHNNNFLSSTTRTHTHTHLISSSVLWISSSI